MRYAQITAEGLPPLEYWLHLHSVANALIAAPAGKSFSIYQILPHRVETYSFRGAVGMLFLEEKFVKAGVAGERLVTKGAGRGARSPGKTLFGMKLPPEQPGNFVSLPTKNGRRRPKPPWRSVAHALSFGGGFHCRGSARKRRWPRLTCHGR